jgi:HlyD family secretion protein
MTFRAFLRQKVLLVGAVLLGLIVASYFLFGKSLKKEASYTFVSVTQGNVESTISCSGTLSPVIQVEVGTQVSGIIDKVLVDFNDRVHQGEVIALIDTSLLKLAVTDAESNLLKGLAQYEESEANHERSSELFKRGLVSKAEYQPVKTALRTAEANLTSARAALERAEQNLRYAIIRSPINGTVTARSVEAGQTVAASFSTPTLFTIAQDLSKMEIKAMVDESDIGQIRKGQAVRFTVQAYPENTFEGKVKQVRVQPTISSNVVNYTVVISADNPDNLLLPGMTATVDFIVERRTNVMLVPNAAFRFQPTEKQLEALRVKMNEGGPAPGNGRMPPPPDSPTAPGRVVGSPPATTGDPANSPVQQPSEPAGTGSSGEMKVVYFLDEDGSLTLEPIIAGVTDGSSTEIVRSRHLTVGMQVISGSSEPTNKKSSANQNTRGGMPGPGGPPPF